MAVNQVILLGRLTRTPELLTTQSGATICKFALAVDRKYVKDGDKKTDFFDIVVWNKTAENCGKYLVKGQQCCVIGRIEPRKYEDKNGIERTVIEVVGETIEFLSKPSTDEINGSKGHEENELPKKQRVDIDNLEEIDDENLPF